MKQTTPRPPTPYMPAQIALVALVFVVGLLIRLADLTDLPMDFHPARQYHSAILARGLYEQWGGEYPAEQIPLIRAQYASEARIEPPILEALTAAVFRVFRTDALWIARLFSILFWLAGGVPLYLLIRKYLGYPAALFGLGFFLLAPYGVIASRSFQPDPLMVMLSIFALWALDRWYDQRTWKAAIPAGLLLGMSILVKQVMVFLLPLALLALVFTGQNLKTLLRCAQVWLIGVLALLPAVLYNLWGVFISGALAGQYAQRFFPQLWIDPGFYIRWSGMIRDTVGLPVFLLALAGLLLIPRSPFKRMLAGYGTGYVLYGFVFAHHISTHDYYQLPLFPLAAAGLSAVLSELWSALRRVHSSRMGFVAAGAVLAAAVLLSLWDVWADLKQTDYRADAAVLAGLSARMGGAGVKTIGLMEDYGAALNYYGFILPVYWQAEENGLPLASLNEQRTGQVIQERTKGMKYFILSDFSTLQNQPLVSEYLDAHFGIFYEDSHYRVYDLKKTLQPAAPAQP